MRTTLLLLLALFLASPTFGEVLVYTGTATQQRPGAHPRTAKAILLVDPIAPRIAVIVSDNVQRPSFFAPFTSGTVLDSINLKFALWYSAVVDPGLSDTRLTLSGNYARVVSGVLQPKRVTDHLIRIQYSTNVVFDGGGLPNTTQVANADLSDYSLVFSLDNKRTQAALTSHATFESLYDSLEAKRWPPGFYESTIKPGLVGLTP